MYKKRKNLMMRTTKPKRMQTPGTRKWIATNKPIQNRKDCKRTFLRPDSKEIIFKCKTNNFASGFRLLKKTSVGKRVRSMSLIFWWKNWSTIWCMNKNRDNWLKMIWPKNWKLWVQHRSTQRNLKMKGPTFFWRLINSFRKARYEDRVSWLFRWLLML